MQISNIFLTVLATAASMASADDTTSGTTTKTATLTKSMTLIQASVSPSSSAVTSNTHAPVIASSTSTHFPQPNTTTSYPVGTGVSRANSTLYTSAKITSTSSSGDSSETSSSTSSSGSATSSSASSGAAAGVQVMQGGLVLGALGALVMMI